MLLCGCSIDHDKACNDLIVKADASSARQDFPQAQKLLSDALAQASQSEHVWLKPRVLRDIAETYEKSGDHTHAESTCRSLLQMYDRMPAQSMPRARQVDLAEDRTRACILLSQSLTAQKRMDEAVAVLKQAKDDMARNIGAWELQTDLDARYLSALRAAGKSAELKTQDFESYSLAENDSLEVRNIAFAKLHKGDTAAAARKFEEAKRLARSDGSKIESSLDLAMTHILAMNKSAARTELAQLQKSGLMENAKPYFKGRFLSLSAFLAPTTSQKIELMKEAIHADNAGARSQLNTTSENRDIDFATRKYLIEGMAPISPLVKHLLQLEFLYESCRDHKQYRPEAVQFLQARAGMPDVDPEERAACIETESEIWAEDHGSDARRMALMKQALAVRKSLKDSQLHERLKNYGRMAHDYLAIRDPQSAIEVAEKTLESAKPDPSNHEYKLDLGILHYTLGQGYLDTHQTAKALPEFDKAIELFKEEDTSNPEILKARELAAAELAKRK